MEKCEIIQQIRYVNFFIVNTFVNNEKLQIYPHSTLLIHFWTVSCKLETRQKWLTVRRYTVNLVPNSVQITKQSLETETETEADTTHYFYKKLSDYFVYLK